MEEDFYDNRNSIERNKALDNDEFETIQSILQLFRNLDKEKIKKILKTAATFFEIDYNEFLSNNYKSLPERISKSKLSENRDLSVKEFMFQKNPQTDVDKIVCLAYYLTHYRNEEEFKTLALSKLNTEAAQLKFTNPTVAVDHATRTYGFLIPTKRGFKKLSAIGEAYAQALPDKNAAKETLSRNKPKRKIKKNKMIVD